MMITNHRLFLEDPPLESLPDYYAPWEELFERAKDLILMGKLHEFVLKMPVLSVAFLKNVKEFERSYMILSFLAHYYIATTDYKILPKCISIPWIKTSEYLGLKPVASYASTVTYNWSLIDSSLPLSVQNVRCLHTSTGSTDERWFYLVSLFVDIIGNDIIGLIDPIFDSLEDPDSLYLNLLKLNQLIGRVTEEFLKIYAHCNPYVFFNKVRKYLSGWSDKTKFPNGLEYELEEGSVFHKYVGGSAAQSPTIQLIDVLLSIKHGTIPDGQLKNVNTHYLLEMREYMPEFQRNIILLVENRRSIREFLLERFENLTYKKCVLAYNDCIKSMENFRTKHIQVVGLYVVNQSSKDGEEIKGTGGTSPIPFLKSVRDDTINNFIKTQ